VAKLGTVIWGPTTYVVDYFKPFVVDDIYTLIFENLWDKGLVVIVKVRTHGYNIRTRHI